MRPHILLFFLFFLFLLTPLPLGAEVTIPLQVELNQTEEGKKITVCNSGETEIECEGIAQYIRLITTWAIGFAALLSVLVFMYGGWLWMTARGNTGQVKEAHKVIGNTLAGLTLALGSYVILYSINPNLVDLRPLTLLNIEKLELSFDEPYRLGGIGGNTIEWNKKACPTLDEARNGFDVLFTSYYKPPSGDKGAYEDFWCNVAMQCSCPNGKTSRVCSHGLRACAEFDPLTTEYCNKGAVGPAIAQRTLAVDTNCFFVDNYANNTHQTFQYYDRSLPKVHKYKNLKTATPGLQRCVFTIESIPGKIFMGTDVGDAIWGRHFDYFAGNQITDGISGIHRVKVVNPDNCLVPQ